MARAPRLAVAAAIVAVAAVLALRVHDAATRTHWTHDSVISALAATAHQADYAGTVTAGAPPVGETVEAARWQRFLRVEARGAFARIAADLRRHDTHPPLYFWMLHMAFMAFGAGIGVALALNAVLYALAAATVAMAGWVAFRAALPAAATVALWAALPPLVHPIALMARQYDLLALLGAAGALALAGHMRGHRRWPLALGAAAAGLGLLTHHAAALFLVSTALALGCRGADRGRRRTVAWLAALAPGSWWRSSGARLPAPPTTGRGAAAARPAPRSAGGAGRGAAGDASVAGAGAAVTGGSGGLGAGSLRSRNPALLIVLTHLVLYAAAYATGLVPGHATSARYLVFLLPFAALGTVAALRPARARRGWHGLRRWWRGCASRWPCPRICARPQARRPPACPWTLLPRRARW